MTDSRHIRKTTPEILQRIIELHNSGESSVKIGKEVGLDHSTVLYHLRRLRDPSSIKYSTAALIPYKPPPKLPPKPRPLEHPLLEAERLKKINPGKNYAEYLKQNKNKETDLTPWHTSPKK